MQKKKSLFLLATSAIILFSCTKQNMKTKEKAVSENSTSTFLVREGTECNEPGNPENNWDSVGIYHNQALEYVIQEAVGQPKTITNYVGYSNQFIKITFSGRVPDISSKLFSVSSVEKLLSDTATYFNNTIDSSRYSKNVKTYLKNLISIMKDTTDDNSFSYCFIKSKIVELENKVPNDLNLSQSEEDEILRVTSVARHSLFYWNNTFQSKLNGGESVSSQKRKWWQWLIIGISDVAGGIAGGITTGPTVIGTIAGVVAGAAGASSGAATLVDD
ncbi:MAG: hypothetical protein KGZ59_07710 [Chitinophagaceae bacterium]|nr:hypothetical protein [Chitinophagaceae bacterium]